MSPDRTAVILMGYGSPTSLDEVPEFLSGIYEGRPVPDQALNENMAKYSMFGGRSPSNAILESLEYKLSAHLGDLFIVRLAYKHWKPWIKDSIEDLSGIAGKIIGIPLFPFRSFNVEHSYRKQFDSICSKVGFDDTVFVNGFSDHIAFREMWKTIVTNTGYTNDDDTLFMFTAHSLPNCETELEYSELFIRSVESVSRSCGLKNHTHVFQSQGKYGKNWCGPRADELANRLEGGIRRVVSIPIGFCYDHLEILYDLDYLVGNSIRETGVEYVRSGLPNDSDGMISLLSEIVKKA